MSSQDLPEKPVVEAKLDKAIQDVVHRYGDEVIQRASDVEEKTPKSISTGSLSLDIAIGVGGIPRGHVTEIYGPESSGKTTLALSTLVEAQRQGGTGVFIDMEHVLSLSHAAAIGVDMDKLLLVRPKIGEDAFSMMEILIHSGEVDIVVLDSVAAIVPRYEIESDMGQPPRDYVDKLIDQAMRKLSRPIAETNTCVIFTNQLRQKLDVMFGNPETTTGGQTLKNWASVRLDVRRIQSLKVGAEIIGNRIRVRVVKNRLASPFHAAEFDIMYGQGVSKLGDVLDLAVEREIVTKRGAFYSYGETSIGQGRENSKAFLSEHEEIAAEIEEKVRQNLQGKDKKRDSVQGTKKKK